MALQYDQKKDNAPRVLAKGVNFRAEQIKTLARQSDVALVRNVPLAHALLRVDVGQEIPDEVDHLPLTVIDAVGDLAVADARARLQSVQVPLSLSPCFLVYCVHHPKGDWLMICYPSGNRDEEVFEAPDDFRVDRSPNKHLAFGYGAHLCLGQHLAKMEMRILWEELLPRLKSVELGGEPALSEANFVNGPKRLPIKYEFA